ncbi:MAG: CRISPR system precrRNA processing endoribonuclease RAMP protein Cas6 [Chromatiaceae bacterium]|nr:CRISPR system precrRNA processing endoribonuclease RAMP protein Cas6 [Chromatiaceae bacterium]
MSRNLPNLPVSLYRFSYLAGEDLHLPADPREFWHGVFGLRLREIACVLPGIECRACLLLHHCAYSHLFSGPCPPDAELMRRYDTIPVPHAFQIDGTYPATLRANATLAVSMALVGDANDQLPLVIQTMAAAGQGGLGKGRGRAWLQDVTQILPDGTPPHPVATKGRLLTMLPPQAPPTPPIPDAIRLVFLSPYKPSGQPAGGTSLGHLLMAIVRRISLLQYFYTGVRLEAPFPELKAASEGVRVLGQTLRHQDASRQGKRLDTGGLLGHIDLDLTGIEPLWPYLHLGQWLNVGKKASMGYGRYGLTLPSRGTQTYKQAA